MCTDDLVAQGKGSGPESSVYEPFPWFHVFVPASLLITFKRVVPHFLTWFRALIWLSNSSPPPPRWGRKWIEYWYGRMLGVKVSKSQGEEGSWFRAFLLGLPFSPGAHYTLALSSLLKQREMKLEVGLYTLNSPEESSPLAHQSTENGQFLPSSKHVCVGSCRLAHYRLSHTPIRDS